uniref:HAT C-terminal dimerisation domain-containing protein n=1 Tax=Lepeophtheirus salmonis TaxID=72036 RepID=A0A0K2T295_LEPSM
MRPAIKLMLVFTTTYSCESEFSILTITKSKARNKLKVTLNSTLRFSLSPISLIIELSQGGKLMCHTEVNQTMYFRLYSSQ